MGNSLQVSTSVGGGGQTIEQIAKLLSTPAAAANGPAGKGEARSPFGEFSLVAELRVENVSFTHTIEKNSDCVQTA